MLKHSSAKTHKKPRAQGMVEFALALPVLLMVIYGLLETGRLLFIYSSVVTASRQAARYGSAIGDNGSGTARYLDCAGIRAAVRNVGFINTFADSDILITYDHGVDSSGNPVPFPGNVFPTCPPSGVTIGNGDRISIQVSSPFTPIVTLLPFKPFNITSSSSRTILVSVPIQVDAGQQGYSGNGLGFLKTALTPIYSTLDQPITYQFTITNVGTSTLTGPFTIKDPLISASKFTCSTGTLAGGASTTCTAVYHIQQKDLDAGQLTNTANVVDPDASTPSSATITAAQNPRLNLAKSASPSAATVAGQTITYTYTLTNFGNVTLHPPYTVTDNKVSTVTCPSSPLDLPPGASVACTGTYALKNNDISAGSVTNLATANATFGFITTTSNQASATVTTSPLVLSISPSPLTVTAAGQTIAYTYTLTNITTSAFSAPFAVTDNKVSGITCQAVTSLAAGASMTCSGTHLVTQADMDAGSITDTATATAKSGSQTITSNQASASVVATQTRQLTLTKTASLATAYAPIGKTIVYTYTLKNTGNVTITSPYTVTDNKIASVNCAAAVSPLLPGVSTSCTASYVTVQADIDNGWVINTATASGHTTSQTVTSNPATAWVSTYIGARLGLVKSANPAVVTTGSGQTVTYTYTLKNTGDVALTSPYSVTDDKIAGVDCTAATSPIAGGASTTCTGTYVTTGADVTFGTVTNHATATALSSVTPFPTVTSNLATLTTLVSAPAACDVRHSSLKTSPFGMTIFNNNSYIITIQSVQVYYNSSQPAGQAVTAISLGGSSIWTGSQAGSPATFSTFNLSNATISAGSNKLLQFDFAKGYNSNGTERLLVTFTTNGCAILDSANSGQLP